ncbi:MAG: hypothetical protein AB7O62_02425 [Pirellulales bacterium]
MSTVSRRSFYDSDDSDDLEAPRPRRRPRWLVWGGIGLVVAVWALPMIVAKTSLLNSLARSFTADLRGDISIGSASLGWFSGIAVRDVEVRDYEGQSVVRLPAVTLDRTLWNLLWNRRQLGTLRLEQPEAFIVMTPDGTNIEEVFEKWLRRPDGSLSCPALAVEIVDGFAIITDTAADTEWRVEQANATLRLARDWSEPMLLDLAAAIPGDRSEGHFSAKVDLVRVGNEGGPPTSSGRVELTAEALPLELSQALCQRLSPGLQLSGSLSAGATLEWNTPEGAPLEATLDGQLSGERLRLAAPQLHGDRLRLARWRLPCQLRFRDGMLTVDNLALDCDLGKSELQGPIAIPVEALSPSRLMATLVREDYHAEAHVDLAKLAEQLPDTLRIREGTQVTAGKLDISLSRKTTRDDSTWDATINMDGLAAVNNGQRIEWRDPVAFTLLARDGQNGPTIEKCTCRSSFLDGEAAGTFDQLTVSATYNLNELAAQLDQFIDMSQLELKGEGWTHVKWNRAKNGAFQLHSEFQVRDLVLAQTGRLPWTEQSLSIEADVTGLSEGRSIQRVDKATIDLKSGSDTAQVKLAQALNSISSDSVWPLEIDAQGQLATWLPRLEPLTGPLPGLTISGQATVAGMVTATSQEVRFDDTTLVAQRLQLEGETFLIEEPKLDVSLAGQFHRQRRQLTLAQADLKAQSLAASARDLQCIFTDVGPADLQGQVSFSADLMRVSRWFEDPDRPSPRQLAGEIQGRMDLIPDGRATSAKFDALIEGLGVADERDWLWREQSVEIIGKGRYEPTQQRLEIARLAVTGDMLRLESSGQMSDLSNRRDYELRGNIDCDMQRLAVVLEPYIGSGVKIVADREPRAFSISGSLADPLTTLLADAGLAWTGADLYGFPVGPAELRGKFADGLLEIQPIDVTVSDGRLTTAPTIRLLPQPRLAQIDKGPVLTKVRITPQMCSRGMKFVLPILADAAKAEGTFSVDLDDSQIPLGNKQLGELGPADADISGQVTINNVEIEAGPLVNELLVLIDGVRSVATGKPRKAQNGKLPPAKLRKESVVPFRMVQGRVYHRDLILDFDDVTIKTYGSVGLDQSLALMVEFPIPEKWATAGPLRQALSGKTVSVPFSGTLRQPKFDIESAIGKLTTDALKAGLEGNILEGVRGGLKGLFNK